MKKLRTSLYLLLVAWTIIRCSSETRGPTDPAGETLNSKLRLSSGVIPGAEGEIFGNVYLGGRATQSLWAIRRERPATNGASTQA